MLDAVLVILSLWWFFNTKYFKAWAGIKIGGDQVFTFAYSIDRVRVSCDWSVRFHQMVLLPQENLILQCSTIHFYMGGDLMRR